MKKLLFIPLVFALASCSDGSGPESEDFASTLNVDLAAMTKTASGLYYQDLTVGAGAEAMVGSTVSVHYTGWLANGTEFDSNQEPSAPFTFELGSNFVIDGFDEGVTGMREGGIRKLVVPSSLGYGIGGNPPRIPSEATLVFDVELVEVVSEE
jgi:peptidylprolyl isomerase